MTAIKKKILTKRITKDQKGLELGPWHSPVCAKRDGWNVSVCDVFSIEELLSKATSDPAVRPELIEDVDIVKNGSEIGEIDQKFDYVISSHNFEHLPDPIRFLQGVEKILEDGGLLLMALPDARYTFDCLRPLSTSGEWLEAFVEQRSEPSARQVFEALAYHSSSDQRSIYRGNARITFDLLEQWDNWTKPGYRDVHCSVVTPASFQLLIREAQALGLIGLELEDVSSVRSEFFVTMRKSEIADFDIQEMRQSLLEAMALEMGSADPNSFLSRIRYAAHEYKVRNID